MVKDAVEASGQARSYRSPLRERQVAQTRESILLAFADEILENGIHGLSIAAVAERADVAERTAYRHFANVDALIEALTDFVGTQLNDKLGDRPRLREDMRPTPDQLLDHLPRLYVALDEIGAPAAAIAAITLARGSSRDRRRRHELLERALAPELAHLPADESGALFETMYMLASSVSWFLLTRSAGISGDQAGQAAARIMRALLADLRAEQTQTRQPTRASTALRRPPGGRA